MTNKKPEDTGVLLHVSASERKDEDEPGTYGIDDKTGDDTQGLDEVFADPGKVIDLDEVGGTDGR